jgi:peptidoglycan/LPS O-acetylase OafA/YrhL
VNNNQRYFWLDLVRGLSAITVCAGHLRAVMFVDHSKLQTSSLFHKIFYGVTGLGHEAVIVFFVLSGFFVGGSVLRKKANFKWIDYVISRLSRLWIVLIPALVLTFIIDQLIVLVSPEILNGSFYSLWGSGPSLHTAYSNDMVTFFGNVFFLQNILTPVFGTNYPIWSLSNEFWYYILFPLCAYAAGKCYNSHKPRLFLRVVATLIALTLFLWLPSGIQSGYFIWLLGVIIYLVHDRLNKTTPILLVFSAGAFLGALAYSKSIALQGMLTISGDVIVGLGFSVFCLAMVNLPTPTNRNVSLIRIVRGLSEFSYSLYLTHFPFVILVGAFCYRSNQLLLNFNTFFYFLGWLGFLVVIGTFFWWLFERNTNILRGFVVKHLTSH